MKEEDKVEDDPVVIRNQRICEFRQFSCEDVRSLVQKSAKKTCTHVPMPTSMVIACLEELLLPVITCILNSSLGSGNFSSLKEALVHPRHKVTRPSYFVRVPSYFEALWYTHLYFDHRSNSIRSSCLNNVFTCSLFQQAPR